MALKGDWTFSWRRKVPSRAISQAGWMERFVSKRHMSLGPSCPACGPSWKQLAGHCVKQDAGLGSLWLDPAGLFLGSSELTLLGPAGSLASCLPTFVWISPASVPVARSFPICSLPLARPVHRQRLANEDHL